MEIQIAAKTNDILGEGVIWNPNEEALYWVDAYAPAIRRLKVLSGELESWNTPEIIGSLVFDKKGTLVVGFESGYCRLSLDPWWIEPICILRRNLELFLMTVSVIEMEGILSVLCTKNFWKMWGFYGDLIQT